VTNAYAEVTWRNSLDAATPGLSNALTFRSEASTITSVDQILGDPVMRTVVTTALGVPEEIAFQDLTAQRTNKVVDVLRYLESRINTMIEIWGFAKEAEHNWQLLGRLGEVHALGHPVLVGASRKSFLGRLLADPATGRPRPAPLRDAATTAVSVLAAAQGAWCLRVHDVASTLDAVRVTARWGAETPA